MGQNPYSPNPEQPQYPGQGASPSPTPGYANPMGPGGGQGQPQTPTPAPGYGPQSPQSAPAYLTQPTGPQQTTPFPQQAGNPYVAPGGPAYPQQGQSFAAPTQFGAAGPSPYGAPAAAPSTGAGVPPTGPAPTNNRKPLIIGIIAVVVVLMLIAGAVVVFRVLGSKPSMEPEKVSKSTDAVQGYLEALAAGDADKAKQYAMNPPAESALLTNDFLKASLAKNPITEIQVPEESDYGATAFVSATYKIGSTVVQGSYDVTKVGTVWKLNDVVASAKRPTYWGSFPVTINDVVVPTGSIALFPGTYALGTGTSLLGFTTPSFTVESPTDYLSGFSSSRPELTDKGTSTMIAKSQEWLTKCLAVQETNPKDCGMDTPLPNNATLAVGTMKRTLSGSGTPFSSATPRLDMDDPSKVTISAYISITLEATDAAGKAYHGTASVTKVAGTISGENLTVVFVD